MDISPPIVPPTYKGGPKLVGSGASDGGGGEKIVVQPRLPLILMVLMHILKKSRVVMLTPVPGTETF